MCSLFFLYWNVPKKKREENHWEAKSCFSLVSNGTVHCAAAGPTELLCLEYATAAWQLSEGQVAQHVAAFAAV